MATTNLIVDFLVIGLATLIWFSPIVALTFDIRTLEMEKITSLGAVAIPFVLGLSYILGIAVSRLADDVTEWFDNKWKDEVFGKGTEPNYHNQLNMVIARSHSASDYLSYRRSVIRTARACGINFALGSLLWFVLAVTRSSVIPSNISIFVAICSLLISVWLFRAWATVVKGYFYGIKDLYSDLSTKNREEDN